MNLKNIISRIVAVGVFTVMVGFQSANAQATKTDKASVQKTKSNTALILPGERHPEDLAIDQKMAAQGTQAIRTPSSFELPERHPEDVAIDKKMAAQGIQPTKTVSSSAVPERHPEDVAIDKKMAAQNATIEQVTPAKTKAPEVDLAAPTVEEIQDGSVEKASTDPKVVDADGDGKIDNPESVKTSTAKVSKTNVAKDEDKDQDGVIDKPASKKENN